MVAASIAAATGAGQIRGDEITYALPDTDVVLSFEGTVHVLPGRLVQVTHGRFGSVRFAQGEITYVRTKSDHEAVPRTMRDAAAAKDAPALLAAARLALKAGRPDWFRQALASLNEFAPDDPVVSRLTKFVAAYDAPLPAWDQATFARETFGPDPPPESLAGARCLLYVVDPNPNFESNKLAKYRLALMERVSETFFFLLALDGVDVTLPSRPLVGVWCAEATDYQALRETHGPTISEATGFFSADPGVSVFFDQSTGRRFAAYFSLAAALQKERTEAKALKLPNFEEIARRADATQLVARAAKERADIETVVHESVHQLVALSGLLPASSHPPRSLHEGLATYFEGYGGDGWGGPGSLLRERHARLLKLLSEPNSCSIADVLDDGPRPGGAKMDPLDAYAYAWGATFFLAETRPAELFRFCRSVADESQAGKLPPERLRQLLTDATGTSLETLDAEWRAYIREIGPK